MNTSAANNTLKLSNRLSAAAAMVREGTRVADVGCDHGKLSAWLLLSGRCRFAYAIDISKPSLQKAADLFVSLKLNEVTKTIHDNGLNGVSADEVDDIVIAGLGGDSIMAIIDSTEWLKDNSKHLVLVAASRQALVRRHIYRTGFQIIKEQPVLDAGHYYSVMSVEYTGVLLEISNICAELGSIKPYDSVNVAYINWVYTRAKNRLLGLKQAKTNHQNNIKLQQDQELLEFIRAHYKEYLEL